jgi:hypothetical protein
MTDNSYQYDPSHPANKGRRSAADKDADKYINAQIAHRDEVTVRDADAMIAGYRRRAAQQASEHSV